MTYLTLRADIAAWLNRDDLTAYIPSFIRLAEAAIRRDVRCRAMETTASVAITAGVAPVPAGFIEARRLILDNATSWALDYMPPAVLYSSTAYHAAGSAVFYTIEGDNLVFRPATTETGLLLYAKAFPALTDSADTNWLLTNAYDVYLYGALIHSAPFLKEDARASIWVEGYRAAVAGVNKQENRARFGQGLRAIGAGGP
jgi:hypothetical protein